MAFKDFCVDGKCDVCGKYDKIVVCGSNCGPISYAYCEDCLKNRYEPYNAIVAYISSATSFGDEKKYKEHINKQYQNLIDVNLKFHNKTEEEFIHDLIEANKSYKEFMKKSSG